MSSNYLGSILVCITVKASIILLAVEVELSDVVAKETSGLFQELLLKILKVWWEIVVNTCYVAFLAAHVFVCIYFVYSSRLNETKARKLSWTRWTKMRRLYTRYIRVFCYFVF